MNRALLSMLLAAVMTLVSVPTVGAATADGGPTQPGLYVATHYNGQVYLAWDASSDEQGVKGYNIYRNNRYIGSASGTTYTDSSGDPGDRYYIIAYDFSSPTEFSDRSQAMAAGVNGINPPSESAVNDKPTTPVLAERYTNWRREQNSPHELYFILWWFDASDDQGIAGYNVYKNGDYWKTVGVARGGDLSLVKIQPEEIRAGDQLSVVAFDYHSDRAYSARSQEFTVPPIPDVVLPPGH